MKAIFKAVLPFLIICLIFLLLLFNSRPSNQTNNKEVNIIPIILTHVIDIAQNKEGKGEVCLFKA
ncbi:MAG: hypothetical protein V7749_10425 [Cocleimonas sp.]